MRKVTINFNKTPPYNSLILGIQGEHNNTQLIITPPSSFENIDYFRIIFNQFYSKAFYSVDLNEGTLQLLLPSKWTITTDATIALNGYSSDGTLLAKTPDLTGFIFLPSSSSEETEDFGTGVIEDLENRVSKIEKDFKTPVDGISPEISVVTTQTGHEISIVDATHTPEDPLTFTVENGTDGAAGYKGEKGDTGEKGLDGAQGVTFVPDVSSTGVLTWTNDGDLNNPKTVNLVQLVLDRLPDGDTMQF